MYILKVKVNTPISTDLEIRLPVDSKYSTDFPMSKVCRRASSNVPIR
jgi:hypothetical protein